MLIESKKSYSVISTKSTFLQGLVTKFIMTVNLADGVYPSRSLFGQYVEVSDTVVPTAKCHVISYIDRTVDGFGLIDLDEDPLPILYELLGIESKDYKTFVRNRVYKNPKVKPNSMYYYMVILRDCIKSDGFNQTKAQLVIDNYKYQATSSAMDKYQSINSYVMKPCEETLFNLMNVFSIETDEKKRMSSIVYCIKTILDNEVPSYIESRVSFSQDNQVLLQYILLASEVALFDNFDTFISNLIARLP